MESEISEQYGLQIRKTEKFGNYKAFRNRNILYTIVPVEVLEQEEIYELKQLSDFMVQKGENRVALMVPTKDGKLITTLNEKPSILLRMPRQSNHRTQLTAKELALFHLNGRSFPYRLTKCNRIGQWKGLWEKRLDQMELFWNERVKQHPSNDFEKRFIESFPYYIGLTENAIQYLVDTEIDDHPGLIDSATVCHQKLKVEQWRDSYKAEIPIQWVFDHASRDLAEYIRDCYFNSSQRVDLKMIERFLTEYQNVSPTSSFFLRLMYARLLFPVHYFESIEGYYLTNSEVQKMTYENQLNSILKDSRDYEYFLRDINQLSQQFHRHSPSPQIEWLPE
ncbi:spore coat putative kinase YutH [Litchfieldia alkalitelluris]|uniref:spore coat putative kinase YutH n=1 Tax=Litchfieldia alkalitelluris TaxID=304268 RepID=UPI00099650AA|nr:spore coat protein YutH [Litchfieldia alkalitelluris]